MSVKKYKLYSLCFYIAAFLSFITYVQVLFSYNSGGAEILKTGMFLVLSITLLAGSYFYAKARNDTVFTKKTIKITLKILFAVYVFTAIYFLFFDSDYGRYPFERSILNREHLKEYFDTSFNIVPFKTIALYFNAIEKQLLSERYFIINIIGNSVFFMPFAFFMPVIFSKINKWYKYLLCIFLVVLTAEILQLIMMTGSFDIDDLLLNVAGSMLMYLLLQIKPVKKFIACIAK